MLLIILFLHHHANGHHIPAPGFMNFHTGVHLPGKSHLFLLGGKMIFPQPSPSWQPPPSSHRVTVKSVFLGRCCRFVAGKEGIQDLRTMALGVASTRSRDGSDQRKLGHREPHPIALHSCECHCQTLEPRLLMKCFKTGNCRGRGCGQCCFVLLRFSLLSLKNKTYPGSLLLQNAERVALRIFPTAEGVCQCCSFLLPRCFVSRF